MLLSPNMYVHIVRICVCVCLYICMHANENEVSPTENLLNQEQATRE